MCFCVFGCFLVVVMSNDIILCRIDTIKTDEKNNLHVVNIYILLY